MKVIGFTNKFYTLWEVTEDTRDLGNGHKYVVTHFVYVKNISFDKETAFSKYPGVAFDENLRGKTASFNTEKEVWDNVDRFRFGKYKYEKIDNYDLNYLTWYWDQVSGDHKEYVASVLKANGYEVRKSTFTNYNGDETTTYYLMSPEALENEKKSMAAYDKALNSLKNNEEISFIPEYNLNEDGEYRDENLIFHFNETKEMCYNGYPYYLPVLNGKSKRFKNKNVKVTSYTFKENENGTITVNVENFEISK